MEIKKITNIKLSISENCPEEHKELIELYWEIEGAELTNMPRDIADKFGFTSNHVTKIIKTYSTLSLYIFCKNCNSYEKHIVESQTSLKQIISAAISKYSYRNKCNYCKTIERELITLAKQKKHEELIQNYEVAIENRNWENLSNFEKEVLNQCLEKNFKRVKQHYFKLLGKSQFIRLIRALENIESQHLLFLIKDPDTNYIRNHKYHEPLLKHKEELLIKEKETKTFEFDEETGTMKFRLTVNEFQNHPDSPEFSGTVKWPQKIIFEPNVEYIFGFWQRARGELYLTITPIENLNKLPVQNRISSLPISLQKGISDFLNNMGKIL